MCRIGKLATALVPSGGCIRKRQCGIHLWLNRVTMALNDYTYWLTIHDEVYWNMTMMEEEEGKSNTLWKMTYPQCYQCYFDSKICECTTYSVWHTADLLATQCWRGVHLQVFYMFDLLSFAASLCSQDVRRRKQYEYEPWAWRSQHWQSAVDPRS